MRSPIRSASGGVHPILVTGFEPFGGARINPSGEVVRALNGRTIDGARIIGLVLPCVFGASIETMRAALDAHRPQLVLALGQASGREGFTLERVAINVDDARIADNAGAQPVDDAVVARGPAAHFTTLPIKAIVAALRDAGHSASVSNSAGTFVCNHVFYGLQQAAKRRRSVRSGFMHLPALPEQSTQMPSMPLAAMIEGVGLALDVALHTTADLRTAEGRLD
jgi:pyroglutamyl-peptidase